MSLAAPSQRVESRQLNVCRQCEASLLGRHRRAQDCSPCAYRRRWEATVRWKQRKQWSPNDQGRGFSNGMQATALPERSEVVGQTFLSSSNMSV